MHAFRQQHLRALSWLEEKEAVLNNDDLGDSLAAVEALIRKHEGFTTTLEQQAKVIRTPIKLKSMIIVMMIIILSVIMILIMCIMILIMIIMILIFMISS